MSADIVAKLRRDAQAQRDRAPDGATVWIADSFDQAADEIVRLRNLLERFLHSYSKTDKKRGDFNMTGAPMSDNDKRLEALKLLSALDQELGVDALQWPEDREIDGLKLVCTCSACPEQYDVFDGERQVGYLRLRHGDFRADCPDCGGETVYESEPQGDGTFDDNERVTELTNAVKAIRKWIAANDPAA
jgi:hypothetical protein